MSQIQSRGEPFLFRGTSDTGCLLIHGLTSTPQEMRGLGQHLAGHGHSVVGVRLAGHATHHGALARSDWPDWLAAVEDGYHLLASLAQRVVVLGLSLGGALALLLASDRPVSGVVAMSTPFEVPPQPRLRSLRFLMPPLRLASSVLRSVPKPRVHDYKDPEAYRAHLSYSVFPVRAIAETARMLDLMRARLPNLNIPVRVIHAVDDRGVSADNARSIYARLGSRDKELIWIENSGHVMTVEPAHRQVYEVSANFVDQLKG